MSDAMNDKLILHELANAIMYFEIQDARRILAQAETIDCLKRETVGLGGNKETNAVRLIRLASHEAEIHNRRGAYERAELIREIGDLIDIAANNGQVRVDNGNGYVTATVGIDGIVAMQTFTHSDNPVGAPFRRNNIPPAKPLAWPVRPLAHTGFTAAGYRQRYGEEMPRI